MKQKILPCFHMTSSSSSSSSSSSTSPISLPISGPTREMDRNLVKKFWKMVRVLYFMLRAGISKARLMADLTLMIKRHKSKLAGKSTFQSFIHHHFAAGSERRDGDYEFTCGDTPRSYRGDGDLVAAALEFVGTASPGLPGFGRTPVVRQLRVTDSPFWGREMEGDCQIDEAAEEFILKFYRDLMRQQDCTGAS